MNDDEFRAEWDKMSDDERSQVDALADAIVHVDQAQSELDDDLRHAWHTDSVGMCWFGDDPEWLNRRLYDARLDRWAEMRNTPEGGAA